jgi:hypothetical protein
LEHGSQFAYVPEVLFDYRVSEQSMITRARGFGRQVESFIPIKHGLLYRQAWRQERESVTATFRNLGRLLASGKYLGIRRAGKASTRIGLAVSRGRSHKGVVAYPERILSLRG